MWGNNFVLGFILTERGELWKTADGLSQLGHDSSVVHTDYKRTHTDYKRTSEENLLPGIVVTFGNISKCYLYNFLYRLRVVSFTP